MGHNMCGVCGVAAWPPGQRDGSWKNLLRGACVGVCVYTDARSLWVGSLYTLAWQMRGVVSHARTTNTKICKPKTVRTRDSGVCLCAMPMWR